MWNAVVDPLFPREVYPVERSICFLAECKFASSLPSDWVLCSLRVELNLSAFADSPLCSAPSSHNRNT